MKFTFEEIKRIFGQRERTVSELQLSLAIRYPTLTAKEIFSVFKVTLDKYGTLDDNIEDFSSWMNHNYQNGEYHDIRINWHSTYILKNLYQIIDQSAEWAEQIRNGALLEKLEREVRTIRMKIEDERRSTILQDKYEIVSEFIELISKKRNELR